MPTFTAAKLAAVALLITVLGLVPAATSEGERQTPAAVASAIQDAASPGSLFNRTELYFGRNRPGGEVTEEEFQHFVDVEVTKRFPEGLTLLSGQGQWQEGTGTVIKEKSKVLILLYPVNDRQASREIEQIRQVYKDQFQQESVLRVDAMERVSF